MPHPSVKSFAYKAQIANYIADKFADELKQDNLTRQDLHIGTTRKFVEDLYQKYASKPKAKKVKVVVPEVKEDRSTSLRRDVLQFQSSNQTTKVFDNLTEKEFNTIRNTIRERPGYTTVIWFGNQAIVLNSDTKDRLKYITEESDEKEITTSDKEIITYFDRNHKIRIEQKPKPTRVRPGGQFFPYLNPTKIDLTKYGIWDKVEPANYKLNCLMYALTKSKQFTKIELKSISSCITDRRVPQSKLQIIADKLKCKLVLKSHASNPYTYGKQYTKVVNLGLISDHYFLLDKTKYTSWSIKNYDQIKDKEKFGEFIKSDARDKTRFIDSFQAISLMLKLNRFTPITMSTENIQATQYYTDCTQDVEDLDYDDECTRLVIKDIEFNPDTFDPNHTKYIAKDLNQVEEFAKTLPDWKLTRLNQNGFDYIQLSQDGKPTIKFYKEKEQPKAIFYADFESTTDGEKHVPYMACITGTIGGKIINRTFLGDTCALKLLDFISKYNEPLVYFHNLAYDAQFIIKHVQVKHIINSGTFLKNIRLLHQGKTFTLRDSYAMISQPLASFAETFKLQCKKEIMPYALYSEANVTKVTVPLDEALSHVKESDREEFLKLAEEYILDDLFEHMAYAEFYCKADCEVLMKGFQTFASWIKIAFQLSVYDFVSLPALAKKYLENQGCFDGCYELSGVPRFFIQQCVVGGRVMCADNKKQYFKGDVANGVVMNDFDAVSLYPSAMCRNDFGFIRGKPKILEPSQLNMDFLNSTDGYFVEITNIKINKPQHFPLQAKLSDDGIRDFTNDFAPTDKIKINKYALEDFQRFQDATYDIIRGYYFDEGRNQTINEVMLKCFVERVKYKSEGNPIETVFKLLMNASYGKTIQKEIKTDKKFINGKTKFDKFIGYNANYIKEIVEICPERYIVKMQKSINRHFNFAHVGSEVLSMSKRIMNEVMCLAEDLNIKIYYQDTDSMHLLNHDIKTLADAFETKYGRKLIGKHIGQFHSDFSIKAAKKDKQVVDIVAEESIFLGKKCYVDKLVAVDEKSQILHQDYHIRMKGIPSSAIKYHAKQTEQSIMDIYSKLGQNEKIKFDLIACGAVKFEKNKDMTYSNAKDFTRELCFDQTDAL